MGCASSTPADKQVENLEGKHGHDGLVISVPVVARDLLDVTDVNSLPIDTHAGFVAECKFMDYYDGDTATIVFVGQAGHIEKRKFRFWGYNAKEMKQSRKLNKDDRERNKKAAIEAKELLISLLGDRKHHVIFADENKANNYGRLLGRVMVRGGQYEGQYVDEIMIKSGLAKPYSGGHREGDDDW
jgi:endonuclease YncB( thermonuclease family)